MKKNYIVTGAIRDGIGEAITRDLISKGHQVFGTFEASECEKASTFKLKGLELLQVDHAERASLDLLVESVPTDSIHGLVNAAFYFAMEDPENFDFDDWDRSIAVNLTAPNYLALRLRKSFSNNASIVTITSTEGFCGSFGASAYAATKAAIHNLVKSHANNFGALGIRVNAVAAGWIGGVMDTDEVFNRSREITPLGRLGTAKEIASITSFLLSDAASFVTGSVIVADGGYSGVDTISKFEFDAEHSS